jgi:hypothetical protein
LVRTAWHDAALSERVIRVTPARIAYVLTSQFELCEVLLAGISGIHSSLAKDSKQAHLPKANGHAGLNF